MMIYMIKSSASNYLKNYVVNGNDTYTATWTATAANGQVFFTWSEASTIAANVGGTVLKFVLES